jgi:phosphoribosylaminoimidazole-succinocarboxamide synthase
MPKRFSSKELTTVVPPAAGRAGVGIFHFTDHYSIFHLGRMPDQIPGKAEAITRMAVTSLELLTEAGVAHHFRRQVDATAIECDLYPIVDLAPPPGPAGDRRHEDYFVPLQVIFRNCLPPGASLLRRGADRCFVVDPATGSPTFYEGQVFDTPLIEFTTKLEEIDRFIGTEEAKQIAALDDRQLAEVAALAAKVEEVITAHAHTVGLEHFDGKIETAHTATDQIVVVDTAGTPDENRFSLDGFQVSKQVLRDHYAGTGLEAAVREWAAQGRPAGRAPRPAPVPVPLLGLVSEMYRSLARLWSGRSDGTVRDLDQVVKDLRAYQ